MEVFEIRSDSVLAILDKALKNSRLKAKYAMQEYIDENDNKMKRGLILSHVKGEKIDMLNKFLPENLHKLGILGFVNGEEPDQGRLPLEQVVPKMGDVVSLAMIEQGTYKGNFREVLEGKKVKGLVHIQSHTVTAKDLKEGKLKIELQ
jgi:hypothetical protein